MGAEELEQLEGALELELLGGSELDDLALELDDCGAGSELLEVGSLLDDAGAVLDEDFI